MQLVTASGADVWRLLPGAMAGRFVLAPLPDDPEAAARTVAMLRLDEPVLEPGAAVIVASSGSTGEPKGVVLAAAALRASAVATHERLGGPGNWTCALPVHHVAGLMTLVRSLIADQQPRFCAPDLADLAPVPGVASPLSRSGPGADRDYISLVGTQLARALGNPEATAKLAGFDAVLVGGGPVPSELLGRAQEAGIRVVTSYGMSETCGGCVYDGTALRGVRVRIEAGLVVLSGPMLFAGYRLRPDLTAQALLDGELFTADRGELVAGRLRVLGRLDDVVISGGVNVDLAAVQRRLDALSGGAVAVFGVPDAEWGTRVVALTEGDWDASALRAALVGHFEPAALPKEVRRVRVLPRTATGKIDRRALAASWREVDRWRA